MAHVVPEFMEGLFEIRPCVRKLKYIGCGCEEAVCLHGHEFFKMGKIYESIDFSGATYSIKGYGDGKVACILSGLTESSKLRAQN